MNEHQMAIAMSELWETWNRKQKTNKRWIEKLNSIPAKRVELEEKENIMNKFKVGDRVKLLKQSCMCDPGSEGVIIKTDTSCIPYCIKMDVLTSGYESIWQDEDNVESVEKENATVFKVGDKVKILRSVCLGRWGIDKEIDGEVTRVWGKMFPYLVKFGRNTEEDYEWFSNEHLELLETNPLAEAFKNSGNIISGGVATEEDMIRDRKKAVERLANHIKATTEEPNPFKEYAEWLKAGNDKLEFKGDNDKRWDNGESHRYDCSANCFSGIIWNGGMRGEMSLDGVSYKCELDHNHLEHNHLEYFKPIAEKLYRRYMLERMTGLKP